jgi:Gram-negative bacterial TonB protein C-terminal
MLKSVLITMFVVACFLFQGGNCSTDAQQTAHYPRLIQAEVPLYPQLARTAHISGTVEVLVTVERGAVVETEVKSSCSPHLTRPTIANIKTWRFESEDRASFLVKYVYEIKGKQTPVPENPRLELNLPRLVRIIARPFKPTQT